MSEAVLVTGGAGFIGSHVSRDLVERGYRVVVLDDLSGGYPDNIPPGAEFVNGSILDNDLVQQLFAKDHYAFVFHLAAYAAEGLSHFIRRFNYNNNLIGSINLINASVNTGVRCFVFTSSIAVYGKGQLPMSEEMIPQPEDPYGIAKLSVEMDLRAAHEMFGLNSVVFRPHNVYGEHQNIGDRYRNVIGIFMNQMMKGEPLTVFGDGEQSRAFSYISDVAPIIARSVELPRAYNQVFNVGADRPYSINELIAVVAKEMGVKPKITYLDARNEVKHAYSSHEKVKDVFGATSPVSLNEGICRMAAWAKAVGARTSQNFSNIEIIRNMPPSWTRKE